MGPRRRRHHHPSADALRAAAAALTASGTNRYELRGWSPLFFGHVVDLCFPYEIGKPRR